MKPIITIEYCPKCNWLLHMAHEFLSTFENELKVVTLQPGELNGNFHISIDVMKIFDRKSMEVFLK